MPRKAKSEAVVKSASRIGKGSGGKVNRNLYYQKDWAILMMQEMMLGKSIYAAARAVGLSGWTVDAWIKKRPEFKAVIEAAQNDAMGWWEERGRRMTMDPTVTSANVTAYIFMMCNRFRKHYQRTDGTQVQINQDLRSGPQTNNQIVGKLSNDELRQLEAAGRIINQATGEGSETGTGPA